jgi:hypothetical protein
MPGGLGVNPASLLSSLKSSPAKAQAPTSELAKQTEQALGKINSFRVNGELVSQKDGKINLVLEYAAPDKLNVAVKLDPDVVAKQPEMAAFDGLGFIVIGPTAYLKLGDEWTKIDGEESAGGSAEEVDFGKALVAALNEPGVKKVGAETLNGEACDVYEVVEDKATIRLWVAQQDSFLRQVKGGDAEMQILLTVTDINKPITIKAPI